MDTYQAGGADPTDFDPLPNCQNLCMGGNKC